MIAFGSRPAIHTHDDHAQLTFGCSACVARAEQARLDNAPVRAVTWHCEYEANGELDELEFTLNVKVPDGWDGQQVDEAYIDLTGEAFVMALPDCVDMDDTSEALETMYVRKVVIGAVIADKSTATFTQAALL